MRRILYQSRKTVGALIVCLLLTCGLGWVISIWISPEDKSASPVNEAKKTQYDVIWHPTAEYFMPADIREDLEKRIENSDQ